MKRHIVDASRAVRTSESFVARGRSSRILIGIVHHFTTGGGIRKLLSTRLLTTQGSWVPLKLVKFDAQLSLVLSLSQRNSGS